MLVPQFLRWGRRGRRRSGLSGMDLRRHCGLLRFFFILAFFKRSFIRIGQLCIGDSGVIDLQKISRAPFAKAMF